MASKMFISVEAVRWVFTESKSERSARLVLLAIASHCNDDGYCWPGLDSVTRYTKLSKPSVLQAIEVLKELGEITVERGGRGAGDTNYYRLRLFMEGRVKKGIETEAKGKVLPEIRVNPCLPEEEVNNKREQEKHMDLVDRAIKESHRTGQSADDILKRLRTESASI